MPKANSRQIRQETSLSVEQAKEAAKAADSQRAPERIVEKSGGGGGEGKGGSVLLIATTIFLGYLYFTGRLAKVWDAVRMPANLSLTGGDGVALSGATTGGSTAGGFSIVSGGSPVPPPSSPPAGVNDFPITIQIVYPEGTGLKPESLMTTGRYCRQQVQALVYSRTGNQALAAAEANIICLPYEL